MMVIVPGGLVCLLIAIFYNDAVIAQMSDEVRLMRNLMKIYEKSARPVKNASHPVVIRLGITLTQIFDVDEKNQVLTVNVWLDQEWIDENLVWNPADYGGLKMIRMPCNLIWLPDVVLYNSVDDYTEDYMRSLAMVSHDGNVFWPPIVRFRSSCKIDITYFPWDDQICHLKLGSWAYDGFQVDITNRSDNIDLTSYTNNGEWELIEVRAKRKVIYYPCCPEPFPDVTFYIHIRRRTLYYSFNVIIPCVMLSMLSLTGFLLPSASGEKVTLGLTVLLAFSVFMLLIAESMPATSEFIPLIGIYLTTTMAMTSFSVVFGVFVLNLHHKGARLHRAPKWLRIITLDYMSKFLFIKVNRYAFDLDLKFCPSESDGLVNCNGIQNGRQSFSFDTNYNTCAGTVNPQEMKTRDKSIKRRKSDAEMVNLLRILVEKQNSNDEEIKIIREWEEIASVIDRLFFMFFLCFGIVSTVSLLVLKPLSKSVDIDEFVRSANS